MKNHHPVELDEQRIRWLIRHWRKIRDNPQLIQELKSPQEICTQASHYISAFEIVLKEHGLPTLEP